MWGSILTEANTLTNFNFGFSTYKSDILIHLSQWQYWWWFWFSIFWALYFFIIIRVLNKRSFQFNPIINTSIRGHGKWGDFLVAFIPLSWCGNILVNSNFILRMIEWQNESSLFTIRVQGKQWYWVYKFDASSVQNIFASPKNIGHDRWFINTPTESYCADSYYQAINLSSQLDYKKLYYKLLNDFQLTKNTLNTNFISTNGEFNQLYGHSKKSNIKWLIKFNNKKLIYKNININKDYLLLQKSKIFSFYSYIESYNYCLKKQKVNSFYDYNSLDDTSNFAANLLQNFSKKPIKIIRGILNKHNIDILKTNNLFKKSILFKIQFNKNGCLEEKIPNQELLWGFRQKKYKRVQKFMFTPRVIYDPVTFKPINTGKDLYSHKLKSNIIDVTNKNITDQKIIFNYQNSIKYNRHRSELVPVNLARRLLRVKRTLVLPAHVNITLISNSYDVVHSWFIPGLGIKIDCVPGRSTHHSFYIDNIGFYYGQCAEICGRYHHHMPIRLCALPFEHFLVWWQKRGLKRMQRPVNLLINKSQKIQYINGNLGSYMY